MESIKAILTKSTTKPTLPDSEPPGDERRDMGDTDCRVCGGYGWVYPRVNGKVDYAALKPCRCAAARIEEERQRYLMRACELPPGCENMTLQQFGVMPATRQAYELSLALAEGGSRWLALLGPTNAGKTHLAIGICRRWLERGQAARYAYVPLLLDEFRAGFVDRSYEARFDFACTVPLLLLDDLGAEHATGWVQERLDTIVDRRLMLGLGLVVTSNLPLGKLPLRIASRLQRHGDVVMLQGRERR